MKVLLIEPPFGLNQVHSRGLGLAEPLSLEMLAASIPHHDVRILDMRLDPDLGRAIEAFQPQVIGAGCYTTGVYTLKALFKEIKTLAPEAVTVVGGHHATLIPGDFHDPNIDAICIGEGERALSDLVDTVERKGDLWQVDGLAMKKNGSLELTPQRPLLDLNELPLPNRELVAEYRPHYFRQSWKPIYSLNTERGCSHRCHFCSMWKFNRGKYRVRSAASVVGEIGSLPGPYIDFIDDNTLHDVKRAGEIADRLKQEGIRKNYKAYARSDTVAKHPELIEKWREIGLKIVLVGLESFKQADLQALGKRNSIENNEAAIRVLQANDIDVCSYFVIRPDWEARDFEDLMDYIRRWNLTHPIFTMLTPLPGTDLYDEVRGELTTQNYEHFDFFHAVMPLAMASQDYYRAFYKLWKNAYSPRNLVKQLSRGKLKLSLTQILGFRSFMKDLRALAENGGATDGVAC